jgi:very-short-patch-repair endonuclease
MVYSKNKNESKHNFGATLNIKGRARELRKDMTESEKILWSYLRKRQLNGMYFRRQHPFGIYILDFYCFEASLVIEVDGMIHLKHRDYDKERTKYLESAGLRVIRFKNTDIEKKTGWVLNIIKSFLLKIPPSQPSPRGEGVQHFPPGGK